MSGEHVNNQLEKSCRDLSLHIMNFKETLRMGEDKKKKRKQTFLSSLILIKLPTLFLHCLCYKITVCEHL